MTPEIRLFIKKYIQSVWQLEVLLSLKREGTALTPAQLATLIYMNQEEIEEALNHFVRLGLVKVSKLDPRMYILAPESEELARLLELTAQAYSERRVTVINSIFQLECLDEK